MIDHCSPKQTLALPDIVFASSIDEVEFVDWNKIVEEKNIYLTIPYLNALESSLPAYDFRYFSFYANDEIIGIGYCQIIKITSNEINAQELSKRMGGMLPKSLINNIDFRILICGNAFASGENGFLFNNEIDKQRGLTFLTRATDEVHLREKKAGNKIAVTLIKEFWPESFNDVSFLKDTGCSEVNIDVNMVLRLQEDWTFFDDYLSAMTSKFRTKAKHVLKTSQKLEILDFDVESIAQRLDEIDELYNTIVDRASFSFGRLNATTLLEVKRALSDQFYFRGYYIEHRLIGFSTATAFDDVLDGNFIGLDYDFNKEYSVYQRILYDFVEHAIKIDAKYLKIGRTAEEIKSGIGALPVEMVFYAKHRNKITNAVLKPFVSNLKPSEYNLRKPFKASYYE